MFVNKGNHLLLTLYQNGRCHDGGMIMIVSWLKSGLHGPVRPTLICISVLSLECESLKQDIDIVGSVKSERPDNWVTFSVFLDLEKILHAERSTAREEGWTFLKKTDLYEVWKRVDSDRPVHLVKVVTKNNYAFFNNYPIMFLLGLSELQWHSSRNRYSTVEPDHASRPQKFGF